MSVPISNRFSYMKELSLSKTRTTKSNEWLQLVESNLAKQKYSKVINE